MKRGRPLTEIDEKQFEKLCALQCTLSEIAGFFSCSEDTIEKWCVRTYKANFTDVFKVKREVGRISLRRSQMRMAETNPTMAIWLGKQYLDQHDRKDVTIAGEADPETISELKSAILKRSETDDQKHANI